MHFFVLNLYDLNTVHIKLYNILFELVVTRSRHEAM